jgi:hypothetical protein
MQSCSFTCLDYRKGGLDNVPINMILCGWILLFLYVPFKIKNIFQFYFILFTWTQKGCCFVSICFQQKPMLVNAMAIIAVICSDIQKNIYWHFFNNLNHSKFCKYFFGLLQTFNSTWINVIYLSLDALWVNKANQSS